MNTDKINVNIHNSMTIGRLYDMIKSSKMTDLKMRLFAFSKVENELSVSINQNIFIDFTNMYHNMLSFRQSYS